MANRTHPAAKSIRGTDPQNLVEKILRTKIYQTNYWKQHCFGLNAATLVDKAAELDHVGGAAGKPSPFMCLLTKLLQLQPEKEIVVEYIKREESKYLRVLGAFYLRLTGIDVDVYRYLEPLYNDFRKLRQRLNDGKSVLTHVDVFIDELLTKDYSCDIALPHIKKRWTLESLGSLEPRRSALEDEFEEEEKDEDDQPGKSFDARDQEKDHYHERSPFRGRDRDRRRDSYNKYRDRVYDRGYERDRGRRQDRDRGRNRELDRYSDRHHHRERDHSRRRSHSRSRSRSRDGNYGDGNRHRRHGNSTSRDEPKKKEEKKLKKKDDDGTDHPDPEIAEANRLRASLGLKPLKL